MSAVPVLSVLRDAGAVPAAVVAGAAGWLAAGAAGRLSRLEGRPARAGGTAATASVGRLRRWRSLVRRPGRVERDGHRVAGLCGALAPELRAGAYPATALRYAVRSTLEDLPDTGGDDALAAFLHRLAGADPVDVPGLLAAAGDLPGAGGLRGLSAAWTVAVDRGVALAEVVTRVSDAVEADLQARRDLAAETAGARTTARLLAALPLGGIALGSAMGAHPVGVLIGTVAGRGCLVAGLALAVAGWAWTRRILSSA